MGKNNAQHDAALVAMLLKFRDQCADMAEGYIYGHAAARAIRTIGVDAVLCETATPGRQAAMLTRRGLECTPAMRDEQLAACIGTLRRAGDELRRLHALIEVQGAELERLRGTLPLDEIHGSTAANADAAQAAA